MILTLCEISLFHGTGSCNRGAGGGSTLPFGVESLQYTVESNDSIVCMATLQTGNISHEPINKVVVQPHRPRM